MGYTFSQLIFLILGILYGITTIYSFIRLFYIRKFASDCYLAKYFYVLLVVENVLSGAWFFLLGLFDQLQAATLSDQKQKEEKRLFWSLILVPDALFLITFWSWPGNCWNFLLKDTQTLLMKFIFLMLDLKKLEDDCCTLLCSCIWLWRGYLLHFMFFKKWVSTQYPFNFRFSMWLLLE